MSADETDAEDLRRAAETHAVIKGRRWRVSDPAIDDETRQSLIDALMDARRAVKSTIAHDDDRALVAARSRVNDAKIALGERGPKWWEPMSGDDVELRVGCATRSLESVGVVEVAPDHVHRRLRLTTCRIRNRE